MPIVYNNISWICDVSEDCYNLFAVDDEGNKVYEFVLKTQEDVISTILKTNIDNIGSSN